MMRAEKLSPTRTPRFERMLRNIHDLQVVIHYRMQKPVSQASFIERDMAFYPTIRLALCVKIAIATSLVSAVVYHLSEFLNTKL